MSNSVNTLSIKELARQAKKRLLTCNYAQYKKEKKALSDIPAFYLNNKVVSQEEMCRFYERVADLLDTNDIITNPLARLTDYDYYKTLDEDAKARYIYGISSIYIYLKERYIREKKEKRLRA
jgi:hypothetical protein